LFLLVTNLIVDVATISTSTTVVQTKTIDAVASTTQVVVSSVIQEFALQTSGVGCVGAQNLITLATLGSEDTDTAIQECATVCLETGKEKSLFGVKM
jgi:hypothetical protein